MIGQQEESQVTQQPPNLGLHQQSVSATGPPGNRGGPNLAGPEIDPNTG